MIEQTNRITVKRFPKRASYDLDYLKTIINIAMIGHLAFEDAGSIHSIPLLFWLHQDHLYCHCAMQSRLTQLANDAKQVAISFVVVDGFVLAKSAPKHSLNYRSVVVYGVFKRVCEEQDKLAAMKALMDLHHPQRWRQVIPPTVKELANTSLLKIRLSEAVSKHRSGPPNDKLSDRRHGVWSGEIPVVYSKGLMRPDSYSTNMIGKKLVQYNQPCAMPDVSMMQGRYARLEKLDMKKHCVPLFAALCLQSDKSQWEYLPYGPFIDYNDFHHWLNNLAQRLMIYIIHNHVTDQVLGMAAYQDSDENNRAIEVGSVLYGAAMQKTPLATEAMYLMMKQVFESGYRRYVWKCDALNHRSHQAALRLGFQFEGVWRQAMIVKGMNRDTAWHSILDSEWPLLNRTFKAWLAPSNFDDMGQQKQSLSTLRDDGTV